MTRTGFVRDLTITVRIVPCDDCFDERDVPARLRAGVAPGRVPRLECRRCDGRGQVVATTERLLVGLVLAWDRFR